jgi:clan AA aspartic protease
MIVGIVKARAPLIRLTIHGFRGREREIEAVVDTGYTGWLTLPPAVISALSLRWRTFSRGILADGSVSFFDVYQAKVVWDGRVRPVFVDEFDATPLAGMALLRGCELKMQVRARGKVTIKRLPRKESHGS